MTKKCIDKENAMSQIKTILSELLPDENMRIVFNIPGGSDSPERLKTKIRGEYTTFD